ncbi:ATP-binding protein [Undibacterium sp. Rencai35W]|uniref:ATP-binding protein n=1 Tax=Undibacterium sp. Rencai35W TaxID=3413046 RepID=UPI003BF365A5
MDGFKRKLKHSLQFKLSVWLCVSIIMVAIAAGIFSFASGFQEANELQDDQLKQIASMLSRYRLSTAQTNSQDSLTNVDPDSRVIIQVLSNDPNELSTDLDHGLVLSDKLPVGIQTIIINGESWRFFIKLLSSGSRIAVGQQTAVRDEVARDSAFRTLMPFLVLIPLLLVLIRNLIRQMFRPLKQLASDLLVRSEHDLNEVSGDHVPHEIIPFITSINHLLSRVKHSITLQKRFVTDAAHELRSPLTALSLQAERLSSAEMSVQARERLVTLQKGLNRSRLLLDQLLMLARMQEPSKGNLIEISIGLVLRRLLEDLMPLAEQKNIDVGVVSGTDIHISTYEFDLTILLKNIVENAIRYTPKGGRVDISTQSNESIIVIQIDDSGPGIPDNELQRVFDPFYRVLGSDEIGSGLGLSIVQSVALRIGAEIQIENIRSEEEFAGLSVKVIFNLKAH